ncbi:MAG: hypothetical protein ACR2OM_01375 [Aestuariivirgaceae bacterium]
MIEENSCTASERVWAELGMILSKAVDFHCVAGLASMIRHRFQIELRAFVLLVAGLAKDAVLKRLAYRKDGFTQTVDDLCWGNLC